MSRPTPKPGPQDLARCLIRAERRQAAALVAIEHHARDFRAHYVRAVRHNAELRETLKPLLDDLNACAVTAGEYDERFAGTAPSLLRERANERVRALRAQLVEVLRHAISDGDLDSELGRDLLRVVQERAALHVRLGKTNERAAAYGLELRAALLNRGCDELGISSVLRNPGELCAAA